MLGLPRLWVFLCERWLGLDQQLSFCWWRALGKSSWSVCVHLRTSILRYDAHPYPGQKPEADRVLLSELMLPGELMKLVEDLVRQKLMLRRDAGQIEEAILQRLDSQGEWR